MTDEVVKSVYNLRRSFCLVFAVRRESEQSSCNGTTVQWSFSFPTRVNKVSRKRTGAVAVLRCIYIKLSSAIKIEI